jgi:hypothetical protein
MKTDKLTLLLCLVAASALAQGITVKGGATSNLIAVDATSLAAHTTEYDPNSATPTNNKATYTASTATFTPAATTTDLCRITGSATKTVRVWSMTFSGTQTTAGNTAQYVLQKRSTANTGGTFVAATTTPQDSASAPATVTVGHYTANPTTGTSVGNVRAYRVVVPATASLQGPITIYDLDEQSSYNPQLQSVVLRGTAQELVLNGTGAAVPTGAANYQCDFVWTEE